MVDHVTKKMSVGKWHSTAVLLNGLYSRICINTSKAKPFFSNKSVGGEQASTILYQSCRPDSGSIIPWIFLKHHREKVQTLDARVSRSVTTPLAELIPQHEVQRFLMIVVSLPSGNSTIATQCLNAAVEHHCLASFT